MIVGQLTKIHLQRKQSKMRSTSRKAVNVNVSEVDADGKSLHLENLEQINGELLNHEIAEVMYDKPGSGRLPNIQRG